MSLLLLSVVLLLAGCLNYFIFKNSFMGFCKTFGSSVKKLAMQVNDEVIKKAGFVLSVTTLLKSFVECPPSCSYSVTFNDLFPPYWSPELRTSMENVLLKSLVSIGAFPSGTFALTSTVINFMVRNLSELSPDKVETFLWELAVSMLQNFDGNLLPKNVYDFIIQSCYSLDKINNHVK